uniref:Reverse transcriptase domain-containing protein n=1 Tax=Tanacetum cinerariifolium TaxID=118510 RepID=A0A6L2P1Z2_TANCI|nr:reverse transcriptase domain-containing protein [Tanacetum cinerariifolium]
MSMPTQWERMGTPTQCDMLCDTFMVSLVAYSASYSKPEWEIMVVIKASIIVCIKPMTLTNIIVDVLSIIFRHSLLLTSICCDDAYPVMPRDSTLAGCDRLYRRFLMVVLLIVSTDESLRSSVVQGGSRGSFEFGVGTAEEGVVVYLVSKYEFWLQEVHFLRYVVNRLAGYYRRFITDFSKIAKPLTSLKQKNRNEIRYHPRKSNVVAEALSRKERVKPRRVENTTAEMLRGLDQLMERKEDGEDYKMEKLARLYIDKIVAEHEVPMSIISNRDGRFTSRVLEILQKALGTRLDMMSISYHPQTDEQSERTIQTLEDMLRASPVLWAEIRESKLIGLELVQDKGKAQSADANLHVHLEEIKVDKTLRFVEEPVEIINREVKSLKRVRLLSEIVILIWDQMSTPTQWERMGTPTQCDMMCDTFLVSLVTYSASYSKPE